MNIVLISRSLDKLQAVAREIGKNKVLYLLKMNVYSLTVLNVLKISNTIYVHFIGEEFGVKTKVIDVDFTHGAQIYDKIRPELEKLDIGVLVNNVGISYDYPEYFVELIKAKPKFMRDIVEANIHSVLHMTSLVLPEMVNKKKGIIINISSTAGVIPNPLLTIYSATKV